MEYRIEHTQLNRTAKLSEIELLKLLLIFLGSTHVGGGFETWQLQRLEARFKLSWDLWKDEISPLPIWSSSFVEWQQAFRNQLTGSSRVIFWREANYIFQQKSEIGSILFFNVELLSFFAPRFLDRAWLWQSGRCLVSGFAIFLSMYHI